MCDVWSCRWLALLLRVPKLPQKWCVAMVMGFTVEICVFQVVELHERTELFCEWNPDLPAPTVRVRGLIVSSAPKCWGDHVSRAFGGGGGVLLHRHLGRLVPPLLTWVLWRQHVGFNPRTVACKRTVGLYVAGSTLSGGRSQWSHFFRVMRGSLWGSPALFSCCSRVNLACGGAVGSSL